MISRVCLLLAFATTSLSAWRSAPDSMLTEWGEKLTPDTAWREYPRPALARESWTNLNGLWQYAIVAKDAAGPEKWDGEILVPFAVESALSGVKKRITPQDAIWYQREFEASANQGKKVILHFEAVDYQTTVRVNGEEAGQHTGGNLPFSFDITADPVGNKHAGSESYRCHRHRPPTPRETGEQARRHLVHAGQRHLADGVAGGSA